MRFTPHHRLIDHLVGQLFYKSADAALRELLQNAEDACALQKAKDPSFEPTINVSYSVQQGIVEVRDNGLGMNQEAIDRSFTAIGAHKEDVAHIKALLLQAEQQGNRQIAFFGIGILSCFGVASSMTVRTKMDDFSGVAFEVKDYHDEFVSLQDIPTDRGTWLRLKLKTDGPMRADQVAAAVQRYARHAAHIDVTDLDKGQLHPLSEQWIGRDMSGAIALEDSSLRAGYLALHPAWDQGGGIPQSALVLCNGGFLVREGEINLLPRQAVGYVGELDVKPGELSILINREEFRQDEKWAAMTKRLTPAYNRLIRGKVSEWESALSGTPSAHSASAIEQGVILLSRGPTRGILEPDIAERVDKLILTAVRLRVRGTSDAFRIGEIVERARAKGVIYYTREGDNQRQFQQAVQQGTGTIQVTETLQTEEIRSGRLKAKGGMVLALRQRSYGYNMSGSGQNLTVHEVDLLNAECQKVGMRLVDVRDATAEEVALIEAEESALISGLLDLGEQLKFVLLDGSTERILRDQTGRLLNCRNPEIRDILQSLPDAIGNPVRRLLLQIYMDVENYRFSAAQQKIKKLLTMPDLAEQSQLTTGECLRGYLQRKLRALLEPPEAAL
jgi:hypothetical protein